MQTHANMIKQLNVLKDNVLVTPIVIEKIGNIDLNASTISRSVYQRHNCGNVVAVGVDISEIKTGDVVGYSTLDGVDVVYDGISYILLSRRETQCKVIGDNHVISFGAHDREDINDVLFSRQYEGFKGAVI